MSVGLTPLVRLDPIQGIRLGSLNAGIRQHERPDVLLIEAAEGSVGAGVFTRNACRAAPVVVASRHLQQARPRWLLVNSGNANAGTGDEGLKAALFCCQEIENLTSSPLETILPFSTGVIGEPLPIEKIVAVLPKILARLEEDAWLEAACAIMTTDTQPKGMSQRVVLNGNTVTVTGIAKGSGMICPNMATMLAFIATDAPLSDDIVQYCLHQAVNASFNRITVDGDTSTNDACTLLATGRVGIPAMTTVDDPRLPTLIEAINQVAIHLAQSIIRDGEGATKFITIDVVGGKTDQECRDVAYTVAHSPLVKTALFASDPNWGRILAAVGRANVPDLQDQTIHIALDEVPIVIAGARASSYEEAMGQAVTAKEEMTIKIDLGRGQGQFHLWTTDLSYEYVRINGSYRT